MKSQSELPGLATQLIFTFILVIILTAVTAGLPAIWLFRQQLDRQAWTQVEQGQQAAKALYLAKQSEVSNFATLTAQRPTMQRLLDQNDRSALQTYLTTLQSGAGLDIVIVCDTNHQVFVSTLIMPSINPCKDWRKDGFQLVLGDNVNQAWITASRPLTTPVNSLKDVIVGENLDQAFVTLMQSQTGLAHTLIANGQILASSFQVEPQNLKASLLPETSPKSTNDSSQITYKLNGRSYYATRLTLTLSTLQAEVALQVSDIATSQNRLIGILVGSIFIVAFMGSVLGVYLTRRISKPLESLARVASDFSRGDLGSPVEVNARVREILEVSRALEKARSDLLNTMDELRRERDWINHLLESIVEGIVTLDKQMRITFFSHGAERITGWDRNSVLNHPCDNFFKLLDRDETFTQLLPQRGEKINLNVEMANGHQSILSVTGAELSIIESGEIQRAFVFRDVSEEESVHRLLGQFLANVSHEFRTPLSALAASIELLLDQARELDPSELEELLNSLHLSALSLQNLVDNLLESTSIETGHFKVFSRSFDLGKIISEAIETMHPLLNKYGQRLVVELPTPIPQVRTDPRRTVQVLVNLMSNASKFGPADAEITITSIIENGWVRIEVTDQGPGIPPQYRRDLFRRFSFPDIGDNSSKVGAGLGLSVVKAIVEAQGGQVGVKDNPSGGTIFWFTLPKVDNSTSYVGLM
jgi:PAS domain S-box-containing protein